ncbi:MAG: hypothetical protein HQM02_04825 [Magnetococcales bacterium]|nr:hypothetical protein [Magnetococcales bacterium]
MRPADNRHPGCQPRCWWWWSGAGWRLLLAMVLLAGCSQEPNDSLVTTLIARDSTLDTLERTFRPASYWGKKVETLEAVTAQARETFQLRNQEYRNKLLNRRESIIQSIQEAKKGGKDTASARQDAMQSHRNALALSRDEAREAGKQLRMQLALQRRAQDFLDKSR